MPKDLAQRAPLSSMWRSQFGTSAFSRRSSVRGRDVSCAQLLVIVLGDTHKLDGFRRLDHLTRADEEDRDPFAGVSSTDSSTKCCLSPDLAVNQGPLVRKDVRDAPRPRNSVGFTRVAELPRPLKGQSHQRLRVRLSRMHVTARPANCHSAPEQHRNHSPWNSSPQRFAASAPQIRAAQVPGISLHGSWS